MVTEAVPGTGTTIPPGEIPVDAPIDQAGPEEASSIGIGPLEDLAGELEGASGVAEETPTATAPIEAAASSPVIAGAPLVVEVPPLRPPLQVDPRIRRERESLRQREAAVQEQEQQRAFYSAVAQRQKELEETEGLAPERAHALAQSEVSAGLRAYIAEETAKVQVAEATNKMLVASVIAERYKVPMVTLLEYNSPEAMMEAAEKGSAQSKIEARLAALEKENAALKKKQVPPQDFASNGVGSGAGRSRSRDAIRDRYIEGEPISAEEKAILFPAG